MKGLCPECRSNVGLTKRVVLKYVKSGRMGGAMNSRSGVFYLLCLLCVSYAAQRTSYTPNNAASLSLRFALTQSPRSLSVITNPGLTSCSWTVKPP